MFMKPFFCNQETHFFYFTFDHNIFNNNNNMEFFRFVPPYILAIATVVVAMPSMYPLFKHKLIQILTHISQRPPSGFQRSWRFWSRPPNPATTSPCHWLKILRIQPGPCPCLRSCPISPCPCLRSCPLSPCPWLKIPWIQPAPSATT